MIEKTILKRRGGKTSAAIYRSNSSNRAIVCFSSARQMQILQQANEMNVSIPNPIVYTEAINGKTRSASSPLSEIIIDDADILLSQIFNAKILLLTMSK